jgi:hypothetical protein
MLIPQTVYPKAVQTDELDLCNDALNISTKEINDLKVEVVLQGNEVRLLKGQRDDALSEVSKAEPLLPWYAYILIGAAGTVVVRGMIR